MNPGPRFSHSPLLVFVLDFDPGVTSYPPTDTWILTAGECQEVGLPGERHEHPSNCNAGQRAVETPESKVDVLKRNRNTESCEVRQEESELWTKGAWGW